jgi:hypothetical protein
MTIVATLKNGKMPLLLNWPNSRNMIPSKIMGTRVILLRDPRRFIPISSLTASMMAVTKPGWLQMVI